MKELPYEERFYNYPWEFPDGTRLKGRYHSFKEMHEGPGWVQYKWSHNHFPNETWERR